MLEELKNKPYMGKSNDLIYCLQKAIGKKNVTIKTVKKFCMYSHAISPIDTEALIEFCNYLGFITILDDKIHLSFELCTFINNDKLFTDKIVERIIKKLLDLIKATDLFYFDIPNQAYIIRHERIPLGLSIFRDILVNLSVLEIHRTENTTVFIVNQAFEKLLSSFIHITTQTITQKQLLLQMEKQRLRGEEAEEFALHYEENRFKSRIPKRISQVDVSAGYDILSFESDTSSEFDRFIEVKAVGKNNSFFWSENEMNKAKLLREKYYIYLINIESARSNKDYIPNIIKDPTEIIATPDWWIEPQSYYVKEINMN